MSSKKAAIPIDQYRGFLVLVFAATIMILLFYGCNVSNAKNSKEMEAMARQEAYAVNSLNYFLEAPMTETSDGYGLIQEAFLKGSYSGLETAVKESFSDEYSLWKFTLTDGSSHILFYYSPSPLKATTAKAEAKVPIFNKGQLIFLTAKLEVGK